MCVENIMVTDVCSVHCGDCDLISGVCGTSSSSREFGSRVLLPDLNDQNGPKWPKWQEASQTIDHMVYFNDKLKIMQATRWN